MATRKTKRGTSQQTLQPAYEWERELSHPLCPVYLLHGDEPYFSTEASQWLKKRALADGIPDFNLDQFDAAESSMKIEEIINALHTQPMMSTHRVVVIQSAELLNKLPKTKLSELISFCEKPHEEICLIFEARARLDQSRSLMKALSKSPHVFIRESSPMNDSMTDKWLNLVMKSKGLKPRSGLTALLQETSEGRVGEMLETIEKLSLYVAPRVEVSPEDLSELVPEAKLQTTVWDLLDAVMLRQTSTVVSLARALLAEGQEPLGLLALVHRRVREVTAAKAVSALGGGEAQLASALSINGYAAKQVMRLAHDSRSLSLSQLAQAYQRIAQADQNLKGSKLPPELSLEKLLLELCTLS